MFEALATVAIGLATLLAALLGWLWREFTRRLEEGRLEFTRRLQEGQRECERLIQAHEKYSDAIYARQVAQARLETEIKSIGDKVDRILGILEKHERT